MKIEIETKYNIGDQVAVMEEGLTVNEGKISDIVIYALEDHTSVRYWIDFGKNSHSYAENQVYPSRQAIIDIINNGGKA